MSRKTPYGLKRFVLQKGSNELFPPRFDPERGYVITGTVDMRVSAFIRAGRNGWTVSVKGQNGTDDFKRGSKHFARRYTIPYQVPEERLYPAIADMIGVPQYKDRKGEITDRGRAFFIKQLREPLEQLIQSVDPQKRAKKFTVNGIVDRVPMRYLSYGRKVNDRIWFADVLTQHFKRDFYDHIQFRDLPQRSQEAIFRGVANGKINPAEIERYAKGMAHLRNWTEQRREIKQAQEAGLLPVQYHAVRKFNKLEFGDYMRLLDAGMMASPQWATYISHVHPTFGEVILKHMREFAAWAPLDPQRAALRDQFVQYLAGAPKTEQMSGLIDKMFNAGVPIETMVEYKPTTQREVEPLLDLARRYKAMKHARPTMNSSYKIPDIPAPAGWKWADWKDFPELSDMYSCCISNIGSYERMICEGRAHVLYRIDKNDNPWTKEELEEQGEYPRLGAVATIALQGNTWQVYENRAFANREVHPKYKNDAEVIARALQHTRPGPHPPVQSEDEHSLTTELDLARFVDAARRADDHTTHVKPAINTLLRALERRNGNPQDNAPYEQDEQMDYALEDEAEDLREPEYARAR